MIKTENKINSLPLIFHKVAINVPLATLFTYSHPFRLPEGARVLVSFRNRLTVGVVWQADVAAPAHIANILPIKDVFSAEIPLPLQWRRLIEFASRYYHYPLGRAAMSALPARFARPQPLVLPPPKKYFCLNEKGKAQKPPAAAHHKKAALWQALLSGSLNDSTAKQYHPQASKLLLQWQEQGWLDECLPAQKKIPSVDKPCLNEEQQAACNSIMSNLGKFMPYLLLGITGSGKTEVYFEVMAEVFARSQQVLFLLPEINLTPQMINRFQQRFPHIKSVVLHSQTAVNERANRYLQAMHNQAALVIGTRLSVFTPLPELGLIVVDEEHDSSFKQNNELRYNARDLAVWRAKQNGCPIILGSATPSLESYHAAKNERYQLIQLQHRAKSARLPEIELHDVARQKLHNGFSERAIHLLQENHRQGGLSLVYLNRRGFAPALFCGDCGHVFACQHCSAKMVLHQTAKQLRCHHCDAHSNIPESCPQCGNQDLLALGQGTERVEETLATLLPEAKIVRVDRDSVSKKNDWEAIYQQIQNQQIDILTGTQMLAKGHDFAHLNLVVVLNADGSLYSADARAAERLFAQLMQVSGRAGRAHRHGRVLIQTQLPNHIVFQAVQNQNYVQFADVELAHRQQFLTTPWVYTATIQADAKNLCDAEHFLQVALRQTTLHENVYAFGPVAKLMVRLADRERAQLSLESSDRIALHHSIHHILHTMKNMHNQYRHVRFFVDVDPQESA